MEKKGMDYKKAGVDIDAGNSFADTIKMLVKEAWPGREDEIGGFAGGGNIPRNAKIVKGSTDGTGTKAKVAALVENFVGLGQDGVAMSAVDMYVSGAMPTYLLDTLCVGKLKPDLHIEIIKSIIRACKLSFCKIIGGETAELPGMFKHPWIVNLDVAVIGFPRPFLSYAPVKPGQLIYGWPSFGPGSNGFSLLRKVHEIESGVIKGRKILEKKYKELGGDSLAAALLEPTPIWINLIEEQRKMGVKFSGHAHITGGGMVENIPRILPSTCKAVINKSSWLRPPIFGFTQKKGKIKEEEMNRTFNQGIMVVSIVDPEKGPVMNSDKAILIGEVVRKTEDGPQVEFREKYRDYL